MPKNSDVSIFKRENAVIVAGLDLSFTGAGVAVIRADGSIRTDTFGYGLKKAASNLQQIDRIYAITNSIMKILISEKVVFVGVEGMAYSAAMGAMKAELAGVVKFQVYAGLKTAPLVIPPSAVRKFVLGKDTRDKESIAAYFRSLGYVSPRSYDEFDALAVASVIHSWANDRALMKGAHGLELFGRLDYQRSRPEGMIKDAKREHGCTNGRGRGRKVRADVKP